jgi:fumarylacetoacetase
MTSISKPSRRSKGCAKGLPPHRMSASNTQDLYWTLVQLVAHHTCGGFNLLPSDLFDTGMISGPAVEGYGSLMELSADGTRRTTLASGETPTFLQNGDEVILRAHCRRPGFVSIGFGECRARIIA